MMLLLSAAGCDDFSLLDQFRFLDMEFEKSQIRPGEQCLLRPLGGTGPYAFSLADAELFDDGVNQADPGSIENQTYTAGNSIGTARIKLADSAGHAAEKGIDVIPWEPSNFTSDGAVAGPNTVNLAWAYDSPGYIGGFRLWRSKAGEAFEEIAALGIGDRSYEDLTASPQMNVYRLYTSAGGFLSAYAETSAKGNP